MDTATAIPDSITPLQGMRAWTVSETGRLEPVHQRQTIGAETGWATSATAIAGCAASAVHKPHHSPHEHCGCGLYALSGSGVADELCRQAESALFSGVGVALGIVKASGKIIQHRQGFRAEKMTVERLWLLRAHGERGDIALAKKLSERYKVPVILATVEDALAALKLESEQVSDKTLGNIADELAQKRRTRQVQKVLWPLIALISAFGGAWPLWAIATGVTTVGYLVGFATLMFTTFLTLALIIHIPELTPRSTRLGIVFIVFSGVVMALGILSGIIGSRITTTHYQAPRLAVSERAVFFVDGKAFYRTRAAQSGSATLDNPIWQRCTSDSPASCTTIRRPSTLNKGEALLLNAQLRHSYIRAIGRNGSFSRPSSIVRVGA